MSLNILRSNVSFKETYPLRSRLAEIRLMEYNRLAVRAQLALRGMINEFFNEFVKRDRR